MNELIKTESVGLIGGADCRKSIMDQTRSEIQKLEKNLANKKELLELLESEPKIQRVLDLMINHRY